MEKLRSRVLLSLMSLIFISEVCFSQNNYRSNIVLIIDDVIVTQKVDFEFFKNEELSYTHPYMLGEPLIISKDLFVDNDVVLKFSCWQGEGKYEYAFNFSSGWIDNTSYTIIKVYNLDKKKYREVFCNQKGEYVIEIKNSAYDMQVVKCKELKCN